MGEVLVVEDDPELLAALSGALEDEGFGVTRARHGLDALGQLRSGRRPCVILLDLMMPIMNGWQFRHEQRQDSELSKIPVVVVSAKTDSAQHAAWLEADAYLEKPLSLGKLLEIVNRFCGSSSA
ncbi:MAG TPA: response regulator [Thermoanaerobaculia bacterium]|nr:response regulator [Thermoanaerobaculia bacterium]